MTIIPESDLYRLVIHSRLPQAEEFDKWVMEGMFREKNMGYSLWMMMEGVCNVFPQWETDSLTNPSSIS